MRCTSGGAADASRPDSGVPGCAVSSRDIACRYRPGLFEDRNAQVRRGSRAALQRAGGIGRDRASVRRNEWLAARSLDIRYAGQGYELNVPFIPEFVQSFHQIHQRRYGYADERKTVEVVNIRLLVTIPGEAFNLPAFTPGDGDVLKHRLKPFP